MDDHPEGYKESESFFTPLEFNKSRFDLKFLLVSDSGGGKTHLCGTYTKGPVHFYMLDPGGEKTLKKLMALRTPENKITIDRFYGQQYNYTNFWKKFQKDAKAGAFDYLAENNGLLVMPDSLTAANDMAMLEIAKKNGRSLTKGDKPMRIQDWGQLISWMKELITWANELPCAVAMPAHLYTETDSEGAVVARYPYISGQFRTQIGRFFDEVYLLYKVGQSYKIAFKQHNMFSAKSRVFSCKEVKDYTMDMLATAYLNNDTLDGEGGKK